MRRPAALRAAVSAGLVLVVGLSALAGCSGGSSAPNPTTSTTAQATAQPTAEATPSDADIAALAAVVVQGDPGTVATITLPSTPFTVSAVTVRQLSKGTGETIKAGQQASLHSTWVSGTDGSAVGNTYDSGKPEAVTLDTATLPQAMVDAIVGQQVGVRILVGLPGTDSTNVIVVDVASVLTVPAVTDVPQRAEGTAVTPAAGLPTVTLGANGEPSISTPTGAAPTSLVVQPLITGTGAAVKSGQTVILHYTGWLWDGTQFDSSWKDSTPISYPVDNFVPGFTQGVVGQTVGSQVLLVIPPSLGYGDTASGSIPAGSTLVFVVDVLWAG